MTENRRSTHHSARRVAIVNQPIDDVMPPNQSSLGIWSYRVANELATRGWDVSVHAKLRRDDQPPSDPDDRVRYRFTRTSVRGWNKISELTKRFFAPTKPMYARWWYYLDYLVPIALRLRRERPDFIHVHNFTSFIPVIRRMNPDSVLVLHMACEWLSQLDEKRMRSRVASCDLVLGWSDYITDLVRDRFPEYADRCATVWSGVDPEAFTVREPGDGPEHDAPLVFVGRVSPEKGVHDLIAAFTTIGRAVPTTRLVLAGPVGAAPAELIVGVSSDDDVAGLARFYEADYGDLLRDQIPSDLAGRVEFTGSLSHEEIAALMSSASVVVNPSYSESFGMSIIEAMACGVPVVATRVGGMTGTIDDGETGFLVDRGDVDGLAAAVLKLLHDDDLRREMGRTARERVERFTWREVTNQLVRTYDDVPSAS